MDNLHMNRSLGTKWFTFYTKVRPWLACLTSLSVVVDFFNYMEVYTSFWRLMLQLAGAVAQAVVGIMVFVKSRGDYIDFVRFVKGALWFETIYIAYGQGVQQYINNGFEFGTAFVIALIIFVIAYFVWYRLNMKYFNKRVIPVYYVADTEESVTYTTPSVAIESVKTSFCRKCGNKLLDGAKFCNKCGTEVIEEARGNDDEV